jgi:hypothetical protein
MSEEKPANQKRAYGKAFDAAVDAAIAAGDRNPDWGIGPVDRLALTAEQLAARRDGDAVSFEPQRAEIRELARALRENARLFTEIEAPGAARSALDAARVLLAVAGCPALAEVLSFLPPPEPT